MICAIAYWFVGSLKQAKQYAEKAHKIDEKEISALCILGWLLMVSNDKKSTKKSAMHFANAVSLINKQNVSAKEANSQIEPNENKIKEIPLPLLAMYGLVKCYQKKQKLDKAIQCINQIIVSHPW